MKRQRMEKRWKKLMINIVAKTVVLVVLIDDRNHDQVKSFDVII